MRSFTGTGCDLNFTGGPNLDCTTNFEGFAAGLPGSGAAASTCNSHWVCFAFWTKLSRTVAESPGILPLPDPHSAGCGGGATIEVEVTMVRKMTRVGIAAAGFALFLTPMPARAQIYNDVVYLTFSGPVKVPGVTLAAGTYRFELADPDSRKVMQVSSRDRSHVYAMFMTIPSFRPRPTYDPVVTFKETAAGVPPAIRALFYGGETTGYEFFYPKVHRPPAATRVPIAKPLVTLPAEIVPGENGPLAPPEVPAPASTLPLYELFRVSSLVPAPDAGLLRRRLN